MYVDMYVFYMFFSPNSILVPELDPLGQATVGDEIRPSAGGCFGPDTLPKGGMRLKAAAIRGHALKGLRVRVRAAHSFGRLMEQTSYS